MRIVLSVVIWFLAVGPVEGRWYSPRVLSPHHADTHSLKTFAQFERWRDLEGDEKVYLIYQYLTDRRTGIYPLGVAAREGPETFPEYSVVTDPVKMLNVYPIGHCGTLGPTMAGIMEGMGVGPARTLVIPGWNHVASEVFYNGQWHYLDLDVRAVFRRPDGSLASMDEAQHKAILWQQPNSPLFFPLDPIDHVREVYANTAVGHRYRVASGGHTMDYILRQGETFTRWWRPQDGRWNHHGSYAKSPFPRKLIETDPRGPKCKHPSFTIHTHGNGRFLYKPSLTSGSSDFQDGVYEAHNLEPSPAGLTLKESGEGHAIFEVRTPYVIAPRVGNLETSDDDCDSSVVTLQADGASLAISLDGGLTWQGLAGGAGRFDLTQQVSGTYGYLLRIGLEGEPGRAVVRSLEIATWVQVHPASLPSLRAGRNIMRLVTGDHHGLPTRVVEVRPNANEPGQFLKHLLKEPEDYDPARATSRIRGSIVAKVSAPPHSRITWFSAGASFSTYQRSGARNTRNRMAYAVNSPDQFREFYRAQIPPDQDHWHYNADREVRLKEPTRVIFVRYLGDPAVNQIRIYAHCLDDRPLVSESVTVTHVWSEGGARKQKQVHLAGPGEYEIEAGPGPVDESITLSVPTGRRPVARTATGIESIARPGMPRSPMQPWVPKAPKRPLRSGQVIRAGNVEQLFSAVEQIQPGGTLLLADGHYWMPRCLWVRTDDVTVRSESGNREGVILDGAKSRHGELLALHACSGVTIADLTIQNVKHNGIKINSDSNVQRVTIENCVLHNIWQRAVKGVRVPLADREAMRPKDCRIQYCLFYNDRPKRFSDDATDTAQTFNGNYVGGIDVMYAKGWSVNDNVFIGIQGRTRSGRGAVFLWHEAEDCLVERNIIVDCDTGIALGNSHRPAEVPVHATRCVVRNNFVTHTPESGVVADYTKDCQIVHNTIHDPQNRLGRLIRLVHDNDGLLVANNLLSGPAVRNESSSSITFKQNVAQDMTVYFSNPALGNLHWNKTPPSAVLDKAAPLDNVDHDIDRQTRGPRPDIGAVEFRGATDK